MHAHTKVESVDEVHDIMNVALCVCVCGGGGGVYTRDRGYNAHHMNTELHRKG